MKKILVLVAVTVLAIGTPPELVAQDKNGAEFSYMTGLQRGLMKEINFLRSDPAHYVDNRFSAKIKDLHGKMARGEKDMAIVYVTVDKKTDTVRYDRYADELQKFEALRKEFENRKPLPPIPSDEAFYLLTKHIAFNNLSFKDTLAYHILASQSESFSSAPYSTDPEPERSYPDYFVDRLFRGFREVRPDVELINALMIASPDARIAVHDEEDKEGQYPYHFFISSGYHMKTAKLVYKLPIEGLDNDLGQFVYALPDGHLVVGTDDVIKLSDDNKVVWRHTVADKGKYEIDSYSALSDGTFVFGGWNKKGSKKNLWLIRLDQAGKTMWEKDIPLKKEGQILALAPKTGGDGFFAVITEKEKKMVIQTFRSFDGSGNQTIKALMTKGEVDPTTFSQDVTLLTLGEQGFAVFGATTENSFEGYVYPVAKPDDILQPISSQVIEPNVTDRAYANFITVTKPGGGFYTAFAAKGIDDSGEDYRLLSFDESLQLQWGKDIGGNLDDGVTSMIIDTNGNLILAGFSYSGISGYKSEPAFEKDHCDVWVVKVNGLGEKLWDKTITGPGCILETRLFLKGGKVGVIFREETHTMAAMIEEQ